MDISKLRPGDRVALWGEYAGEDPSFRSGYSNGIPIRFGSFVLRVPLDCIRGIGREYEKIVRDDINARLKNER